ncbi:hypothetical protein ACFE04_013521 [Oxalis oulophora]
MMRINGLSLRQLISRQFSSSRLFIGGLSYDTNETVLKEAFEHHGEIIEVRVICDTVSGRSKGYGFVRFTSEDAAAVALEQMDGQACTFIMEEIFVWNIHNSVVNHNSSVLVTTGIIQSIVVNLKDSERCLLGLNYSFGFRSPRSNTEYFLCSVNSREGFHDIQRVARCPFYNPAIYQVLVRFTKLNLNRVSPLLVLAKNNVNCCLKSESLN